MTSPLLTVVWEVLISEIMTLLEGILAQVCKNLKGVQVFHKEDILTAIKEHALVYANEVKLDNDEQGEHLILTYDDQIICFELVWRQEGPRFTLIELRLA